MHFDEMSVNDRVKTIKKDYTNYVKAIFDDPSQLKGLITNKKITPDNARNILRKVNSFNAKDCACCRRFDMSKLQMGPLDPELEPLLDIVQETARKKNY